MNNNSSEQLSTRTQEFKAYQADFDSLSLSATCNLNSSSQSLLQCLLCYNYISFLPPNQSTTRFNIKYRLLFASSLSFNLLLSINSQSFIFPSFSPMNSYANNNNNYNNCPLEIDRLIDEGSLHWTHLELHWTLQ